MKTLFSIFFFFFYCMNIFCQNTEIGLAFNIGNSKFIGDAVDDRKYVEESKWENAGSIGMFINKCIGGDLWLLYGLQIEKISGYRSAIYRSQFFINGTIDEGQITIVSSSKKRYELHYISFPLGLTYKMYGVNLNAGMRTMFHYYSFEKYEILNSFENIGYTPPPPNIAPPNSFNLTSGISERTPVRKALFLLNIGASFRVFEKMEVGFTYSKSLGSVFHSNSNLDLKMLQWGVDVKYFLIK